MAGETTTANRSHISTAPPPMTPPESPTRFDHATAIIGRQQRAEESAGNGGLTTASEPGRYHAYGLSGFSLRRRNGQARPTQGQEVKRLVSSAACLAHSGPRVFDSGQRVS